MRQKVDPFKCYCPASSFGHPTPFKCNRDGHALPRARLGTFSYTCRKLTHFCNLKLILEYSSGLKVNVKESFEMGSYFQVKPNIILLHEVNTIKIISTLNAHINSI